MCKQRMNQVQRKAEFITDKTNICLQMLKRCAIIKSVKQSESFIWNGYMLWNRVCSAVYCENRLIARASQNDKRLCDSCDRNNSQAANAWITQIWDWKASGFNQLKITNGGR